MFTWVLAALQEQLKTNRQLKFQSHKKIISKLKHNYVKHIFVLFNHDNVYSNLD